MGMIEGIVFKIGEKAMPSESFSLRQYAMDSGIPVRYVETHHDVLKGEMPFGTVFFVQDVLRNLYGYYPVAEYFPRFCADFVKRNYGYVDKWPDERCFIKPIRYKLFTGRVKEEGEPPRDCEKLDNDSFYVIQDVIDDIRFEWRLYVTNGSIVASGQYTGMERVEKIPDVDLNIPKDWSGTLDFGISNSLGIFLVEAHYPFSCGWYGDTDLKSRTVYAKWCIDGWNCMIGTLNGND